MAFDYAYYEMAEKEDEEERNHPTFNSTVPVEHGTNTVMPMVTINPIGRISPPNVTAGGSDDGITTGGNSSSEGSGDDDVEDDGGGDDEQQIYHRPTTTTAITYLTSNIRTRTYSDEVRYRDAIFRPFLMNQDWDRGPDFRLCRDFVSSCRDQEDNIVPNNVITLDRYTHDTYPYVWDYEWEVAPGRFMIVIVIR